MSQIVFKQLEDIIPTLTSHGIGFKQVLLFNNNDKQNIIQVAYGHISKNETITPHLHPTMEEYYFFLSGRGVFIINNEKLNFKKNTFIKIPHNTIHFLQAKTNCKFIYWGSKI